MLFSLVMEDDGFFDEFVVPGVNTTAIDQMGIKPFVALRRFTKKHDSTPSDTVAGDDDYQDSLDDDRSADLAKFSWISSIF
jgi:hypothetical protein